MSNITDIHRPLLQKECDKNKFILEKFFCRKGIIYLSIRRPKKKEGKIGVGRVRFSCNVKNFNISRIIKRVSQHFGLMPYDRLECVPETCGKFYSENVEKYIIYKCRLTGKECTQLKYKGKP